MPETHRKGVRASKRGAPPKADGAAGALADFDTQLMLQVREGNRDAANALVRRNFPRIARYIARLVGHQRPVEDLAQDVFLQALSNASRYQPSAKVSTWLYRIATNTSLNYLKQAGVKRQVPQSPDGLPEVADASTPAPDWRMNLDELKDQVSQAIRALPVNQRVALTLFQCEGCSYEQVAAVLDVTVEAVRSLLMRARTTLRRELNGLV